MCEGGYSNCYVRKPFVSLIIIAFALSIKFYAAGSLDPTFGTGGKAFVSLGGFSLGNDVAVQADGKIVVAGYLQIFSSNYDFAVVRFNSNGTLDTTFDGDGKVATPVGTDFDSANTVAIQADGKIIAAGMVRIGPQDDDFALVRYNADGSLDTSFGSGGKVTTPVGATDAIYSIVIQSDGKIVAIGNADGISPGTVIAVARYNPNGTLDTSFDGDGKLTTSIGGGAGASQVALQSDGKILVAGSGYLGQQGGFALVRYNSDGSLDTSFDGDGIVTTTVSPTNSSSSALGIAVQPDGKIVAVGGSTIAGFDTDSAVVRYNPDGSLDTTFDGDGKVYISFTHLIEALSDVAIQPDGKIVAAGYKSNNSGSPTVYDITVARLNPNGSLDTTFDGDGKVITQSPPDDTGALSMQILPNGKIVTAGYRQLISGGREFMVTRYMGDVNTADFDGDTRTDVSIFRPSNGQWWFLRSSNNSHYALQFGLSTDKIVPADYTGDAKTDIAIWRNGDWYILRSEDFSYYAFPFGSSNDIPAPADFDGDGIADPTVFRPSTGNWYIANSTGGVTTRHFGVSGDKPVVADYDGDGKADVAIRRSPAQWWILRSSDGSYQATSNGSPFDHENDKPVVGDYTGDGKADIAFFTSTTASYSWYVVTSENPNSSIQASFGGAGDIPVPGDYDGDGKFDFAYYRPSNGTWNIRLSTGGAVQYFFGTSGDIPTPSAFLP